MQDIPDDLGLGHTRRPASVVVRSPAPERPRPAEDRRLDAQTRRRIGRSLRLLDADLLAQPVPERFAVLVAGRAARSEKEAAR